MVEEYEELNAGHWHEALDRTSMLIDIAEHTVASHPVIKQTPELQRLFDEAIEALGNVYQRIGNLDPFWTPNDDS